MFLYAFSRRPVEQVLTTFWAYSCSVTSFGALGAAQGIDGMGLSQSMNITFIDAAPLYVLYYFNASLQLNSSVYPL